MFAVQPLNLPLSEETSEDMLLAPAWLSVEPKRVVPAFVAVAPQRLPRQEKRKSSTVAPESRTESDEEAMEALRQQEEIAAMRAEAERAGREVGEAAVRAEQAERMGRIDALLNDLEDARHSVRQGLESQLCELSVAIARALVGDIAHEEAVLRALVEEVFELVNEAETVMIRVAPVDHDVVNQAVKGLRGENVGGVTIRVQADPKLAQGCIVDTPLAQIDATLDGRLARVREAILKGGER